MTTDLPPSRHPAALSPEEKAAIEEFIDVLNEKLVPHLVSLTPEQRRALPRMDDEKVAFMNAMYKHMKANPQLVPDTVDRQKFERDMTNFNFLEQLGRQLSGLLEALDERMLHLDPVSRLAAANALRLAMSAGPLERPGEGAPGADDAGGAKPGGEE